MSTKSEKDIHIWVASYEALEHQNDLLSDISTLDADEHLRLTKFKSATFKSHFARSHAMLRRILGKCLNIPAKDIKIATDINSKPYCGPNNLGFSVFFNLSHSQCSVAVAIAENGQVGVDIEELSSIERLDCSQLHGLGSVFSEDETKTLMGLPKLLRSRTILQYWTRKEAVSKANGLGLRSMLVSSKDREKDPIFIKTYTSDQNDHTSLSVSAEFFAENIIFYGDAAFDEVEVVDLLGTTES